MHINDVLGNKIEFITSIILLKSTYLKITMRNYFSVLDY
jgi:hypothetical protein